MVDDEVKRVEAAVTKKVKGSKLRQGERGCKNRGGVEREKARS